MKEGEKKHEVKGDLQNKTNPEEARSKRITAVEIGEQSKEAKTDRKYNVTVEQRKKETSKEENMK